MYLIYKVTNIVTEKVYIGKTSYDDVMKRWKEHCEDAKKYPERKFYRSINKYTPEKFIIEQIDTAKDDAEACEKEKYYIALYDSRNKGYNSTDGGDGAAYLDHQHIIELHLAGYEVREIAKTIPCDKESVSRVLKSNGYNPRSNYTDKKSRPVIMCVKGHPEKELMYFKSTMDAARYIQKEQGKQDQKTEKIAGKIAQVAGGKTKQVSAYTYCWKYADNTAPEISSFKKKVG